MPTQVAGEMLEEGSENPSDEVRRRSSVTNPYQNNLKSFKFIFREKHFSWKTGTVNC